MHEKAARVIVETTSYTNLGNCADGHEILLRYAHAVVGCFAIPCPCTVLGAIL